MVSRVLHRIVANPRVYDWVQTLAGAGQVQTRLRDQFAAVDMHDPPLVLDVGGGTGYYRTALPSAATYVCLDIDPRKLDGLQAKHPGEQALLADATCIPLRDASADIVLCTAVVHHIADGVLARFIDESARVLKDNGTFVFVDPIWAPQRWLGRLLWRYDRGSYPRTGDALRAIISRRYAITRWERFAVYHEYVLCVATKQPVKADHRTVVGAGTGSHT